jgi:sulfite exporter TauE/SafE
VTVEAVVAVLVASLLGSVHCAAMCGAFVCFYAGAPAARTIPRAWAPHAAYNLGRLVSYTALGAIFGAVGAGIDRMGALAGITRAAAILAGSAMILWGVATLLAHHGVRLPAVGFEGMRPRLGAVLLRIRGWSATNRAAATGLVTSLLPCGWLYAFATVAAATGSAPRGVLIMFVFWAGTLPMMLAVGMGAQRLLGRFRVALPTLSAVTVVVIGVLAIVGRLRLPIDRGEHGHSQMSVPHVSR